MKKKTGGYSKKELKEIIENEKIDKKEEILFIYKDRLEDLEREFDKWFMYNPYDEDKLKDIKKSIILYTWIIKKLNER